MIDKEELKEKAEKLLAAIESSDDEAIESAYADLTQPRESELFQEVGRLTRELHDALANFRLDSRFAELAAHDIPDAKDRLQYVIEMTDKAANKTMDAVEEVMALSSSIGDHSRQLFESWQKVAEKRQAPGEFREFFFQLGPFLEQLFNDTEHLSQLMTNVLMAQDFQDLTGQVIKRVIQLVQDVEESLVETIRMFGQMEEYNKAKEKEEKSTIEAEGPAVNADKRDDVVQSQDDVDDLLSSLGF
ncbi:MAG: protein phosphatase CheZ [Gammaproteobacteria bacterium]|nr:MAG: protein phosphatase CheZ [Gammaproteobacteria bacterium]